MGVVIQQGGEYPDVVNFLVEEMGYARLRLPDPSTKIIRGKIELAASTLASTREFLRHRRFLTADDDVVVFSMFSFSLKMLARIGIARYRRLFCLGFFIHSPVWFPLFRQLVKVDKACDYYILFSQHEKQLYAQQLGIDPSQMLYLPYGDWSRAQHDIPQTPLNVTSASSYYFAGGYSNRDYASLIEAFRAIDEELLIVCSALNKDVVDEALPANIKVLRDVSSDDFESFVRGAKACVIPLKSDTGAAGQSVMLRLMRNRKIIIASDRGGVRDYIIDGESGFLVRDMIAELPKLIAQVEADPGTAKLGEAAYERYRQKFSRDATSATLRRLLEHPVQRVIL